MHTSIATSTPPTHRHLSQQWSGPTARLAWLAAVLSTVLISACGGDAAPEPAPTTFSAAQLQGRWITSSGISPARTAIVLPGAASSTELWLLSADLLSLSRLQISTTGADAVSASGKTYSLPSNTGQSATYSGTVNLSNNSLSLNAAALLLTRSDALTTPSSLADVVGGWRASVGGQTVTLAWSIAADGAMSGPSSTGCSYSGALSARSDASAYNARVTETCSSRSSSFAGIATYRASPAALTLAMTSTDAAQTQALVVSLSRP